MEYPNNLLCGFIRNCNWNICFEYKYNKYLFPIFMRTYKINNMNFSRKKLL